MALSHAFVSNCQPKKKIEVFAHLYHVKDIFKYANFKIQKKKCFMYELFLESNSFGRNLGPINLIKNKVTFLKLLV